MTNIVEIATAAVRIYAESHPRPSHVTQKQAAEMAQCDPRTIRAMIRRGDIKLNGFGMIPIAELDRALIARCG